MATAKVNSLRVEPRLPLTKICIYGYTFHIMKSRLIVRFFRCQTHLQIKDGFVVLSTRRYNLYNFVRSCSQTTPVRDPAPLQCSDPSLAGPLNSLISDCEQISELIDFRFCTDLKFTEMVSRYSKNENDQQSSKENKIPIKKEIYFSL